MGPDSEAVAVACRTAELIDWQLSIDSAVSWVHQHGSNLSREVASQLPSHTGTARTTRDSRWSPLTTRSAVPAAA